MKRLSAIAILTLSIAAPAMAQNPLNERLARFAQPNLIAGDGPSYRAMLGAGQVLLLTVGGDGRATLTVTDKNKSESRSFTNQQLDALDAALSQAGFNTDPPVVAADCKPEAETVFESIIDGRYRYSVRCNDGPLNKAVAILGGAR